MIKLNFREKGILRYILFLVCTFSFLDAYNQYEYFHRMDHSLRTFPIHTVQAGYTEKAPVLDGKLDDECWSSAIAYTGFQLTKGNAGRFPEDQTRFYIMYNERFLFIGIECFEENMDGLRTKAFIPDDLENIHGDDRVEVFIDLEHNHNTAINLILSAGGAMLDQLVKRPVQYANSAIYDLDWNGKWHGKVNHENDKWTAEIFVDIQHMTGKPIASENTFGLLIGRVRSDRKGLTDIIKPKAGNDSGVSKEGIVRQLHRERTTYDYVASAEYSSFPYATDNVQRNPSGYFEPINYADLVFGSIPIRVNEISFHEAYANYSGNIWHLPQRWGDNPLELKIENVVDSPSEITVHVETTGFSGEPVRMKKNFQIAGNSISSLNAMIPIREDGFQKFSIEIENANTKEKYYSASYTTRVPPFIEFNLEAIYLPQEMPGNIKFVPVITDDRFNNLSVRLSLLSQKDNRMIVSDQIKDFEKVKEFTTCFKDFDIRDLSHGNYKIVCELFDRDNELVGYVEQAFTRKTYDTNRSFRVKRGMYSFAGIEDDAVIVEFPDRKDFVFAAHGSYIPWWDMNNLGLTYEFVECWGYGYGSCCEPMQDKKNIYTNVDILEESPARVVIRYQYALNNNNFRIFFNEWVDEYYTLYPDGTGIRRVELWANTDLSHEIIQPQYIMPPGILPGAILEDMVSKVFNLEGDMVENRVGSDEGELDYSVNWKEEILRMPLKNRKDPFMVIGKNEELMPGIRFSNLLYQRGSRDIRYNLGGHWPLTNLNVDVYSIVSTNKAYHSWIGNLHAVSDKSKIPNVYTHLFGATDKDDEYLKDVASSWLKPGNVRVRKGELDFLGFNHFENAYEFVFLKDSDFVEIEFTPESAGRENIVNPVLLLHNSSKEGSPEIYINNKKINESDYRYTWIVKSGEKSLLVWINKTLSGKNIVRVKYARK